MTVRIAEYGAEIPPAPVIVGSHLDGTTVQPDDLLELIGLPGLGSVLGGLLK